MRRLFVFILALGSLVGCTKEQVSRVVVPGYELSVLVPGSAMHGVHGLAFDSEDSLYGASLTGYSIYQIDVQSGEVTTKVGPPLGNADDVAVAPDGTIAWTAGAYSAVHALTPAGDIKVLAEGLPAVNSINYSPDGRLFVTRVFGGDALYEVDPTGVTEPREIARKLGGLNGFEVTEDLQLYGPLFLRGKLVKVDLDSGNVAELADGFTVPAAVNIDSKNRLFVVDFDDGKVTRIDLTSGVREVIAELEPPLDNLAINSRDEIFISNPATNTITAVNGDTGEARVVVSGNLSSPGGVAIASINGRQSLLVADFWGNRYFDTESGARTMLELPQGVTASASLNANDDYYALASIWPFGLVYLIDRSANKIAKTVKFSAPYSPTFLSDGSLVVADYAEGTLTRVAAGKSRDKTVLSNELAGPVGVAANDTKIYVSEYDSGRISVVDLNDGSRSTLIEGLQRPEGLAFADDGRLLIAETGTQRLLVVDVAANQLAVLADGLPIGLNGGDDLPKPFLPTGVAVDRNGHIYISADIDNEIIKLTRQ